MAEKDSEVVFMKDLGLAPGGGDNIATPSHPSATHEHMHTTPEGPTITSTPQPIQNMDPYEAHQVDLRYLEGPRKHPKMVVKPETYEGKGDWAEYISHFEDCAELGGWDNKSKCLVLAANLRGAARKYYTGLGNDEKKDYIKLVSALRRRFGGEHRQNSWLSKLEMRKRKSGESVADMGDDIWQMTQRAYYDFDHRSQEQLALKHFYRVIDPEMKVKCVENKCTTIADAVDVVERYEALYEDRRDSRRSQLRAVDATKQTTTEDVLSKLVEQMNTMTKMMEQQSLQNHNNPRPRQNRLCFQCGEEGHFMASCPQRRNHQQSHDGGRTTGPQSRASTNNHRSINNYFRQGNFRPSN